MGTNSKAGHAAYAVTPAGPKTFAPSAADDALLQHFAAICAHTTEPADVAEEDLKFVAGIVQGGIDPDDPTGPPAIDLPDDPVEGFGMFSAAVGAALAAESQLSDTAAGPYHQQLQALTSEYLASLTPDELVEVAAASGFHYPDLVGFTGRAPHPLAVWLDPAVPADAEAKKKIQALAQARYDALCAGETVNGMSLRQWALPAPASGLPQGFDGWLASKAQLVDAQSSFDAAAAAVTVEGSTASAARIAVLLHCENRIATAQNPALTDDFAVATAAARHQVDQLLGSVTAAQLGTAVLKAKNAKTVDDSHTKTLNAQQILQLLRASTSAGERQELHAAVIERSAMLSSSAACAGEAAVVLASGPLDHEKAGALTQQVRAIAVVYKASSSWDTVDPAPDNQVVLQAGQTAVLAWADEQKVADLREFVTSNGIASPVEAVVATKATLGKLLKGHLDASPSAVSVVKQELGVKTAVPNAPKPVAAPVIGKPRSRFGAQHAQLVAALHQAQAAHAVVPKPLDPAAVAAWDFGTGTPAKLGGTHPKTLHTGPDGTTWIAKREGTSHGGANTQAEAAASRLVARAGLPAVPVYATKVEGKPVSVQPMLPGTKPMSGSPSSWSQADVDEIVRLHVTSWALGNHDAHHDNVLRTGDGGLVPIDLGQSFKNFGQDKLALGYRPSTTAVYDQVYDAHLAGSLGKGVQVNPAVAHSVIRRLESVPDAEWRATLHTTAYSGASQNMKWVAPMRARAAKTHGIAESAVTAGQIAESFLDHAVERKKNLRRDFVKFFSGDLKISSASALQHLGKA
ncbi:hypothetical protein Amsp01_050030 [Amycolatopsis sp. NBRC 101858]|uniref:hypothetical protein n=1 Tax=Amycolatopsis sp. NBRC 101858 TaxID=3032200 RepID=UPI00249FC70A|nr:hypothetical protein [Amycolatopsis sp. NBRC 101858]GLY38979.1 hypothetical protein Amsp01_050030 [Amycolatopsis sp. NBRC 101858]